MCNFIWWGLAPTVGTCEGEGNTSERPGRLVSGTLRSSPRRSFPRTYTPSPGHGGALGPVPATEAREGGEEPEGFLSSSGSWSSCTHTHRRQRTSYQHTALSSPPRPTPGSVHPVNPASPVSVSHRVMLKIPENKNRSISNSVKFAYNEM